MMKFFLKTSIKEIHSVAILSILTALSIGVWCNLADADSIQIIKTYEMFLLPFAGCWGIYGFFSYIDVDRRELFLSYSKSRLRLSVGRNIFYFLLFMTLYGILYFVTFEISFNSLVYFIGMGSEIYFWISIGFGLLVISKNIIVSISLIWIYSVSQILDVDKNFECFSIYMYNADQLSSKILFLLIISTIVYLFAEKIFCKLTLDSFKVSN